MNITDRPLTDAGRQEAAAPLAKGQVLKQIGKLVGYLILAVFAGFCYWAAAHQLENKYARPGRPVRVVRYQDL